MSQEFKDHAEAGEEYSKESLSNMGVNI